MKISTLYKVSTFFKLEIVLVFMITLSSMVYVIYESNKLVYNIKDISNSISKQQDSVINLRTKTINFLIKDDRYFTKDSVSSKSYVNFLGSYKKVLSNYYKGNDSKYLDSLISSKSKLNEKYQITFSNTNTELGINERSDLAIRNSELNESIYYVIGKTVSSMVSKNDDDIDFLKAQMDSALLKFSILGVLYIIIVSILVVLLVLDIKKTFRENRRNSDVIQILFRSIKKK